MRYFVKLVDDVPCVLYRFDDDWGDPHLLGADGTWQEAPEAIRYTAGGDLGADEIDEAEAAEVARFLGHPEAVPA